MNASATTPSSSSWQVLPHEPVVQLAENLLWVSGAVPRMSLKRTMVVVRLRDERLLIYSAIAMHEPSMAKLEAFGKPAFLVVPNAFHRLDAPKYKARFPELRVLAPRGARKKVEEVIAVDALCEETTLDDSARFEALPGVGERECALLVRSNDGTTLVLNDVMFNMDRKRDLLGFLFTTALGSAPGPRVSRLGKLALVKDKRALREAFERYAEIPDLVRVIVAHEKVASGVDAAAALRKAATYL